VLFRSLLIDAFARIARRWPECKLTIAGDGEQRGQLQAQAAAMGLGDRVTFPGILRGPALGDLMRRHSVMVVPSLGHEPFGIVALEGLACGCRMVVANVGGLPEAVGNLAQMFPAGDVDALAHAINEALSAGRPDRRQVNDHLARFAPDRIGAQYLDLLRSMVSRRSPVGRAYADPQHEA